MITAAALIMKYTVMHGFIYLAIMLISGIIIFILAPAEDENKPLDEIEIKVYGRRAMIVWSALSALTIILFAIGFAHFAACVVWSAATACLMVIIGTIRNLRLGELNERALSININKINKEES